MSTLTKVFVILLVVFSLTFTVMTVSIVAQIPNWKETAERYAEHARVADTNLRSLIAANAAELASARDSVNAYSQQVADLERKLQQAHNEGEQLRSELAKAASEKSSAEALNRGLLAQLQVAEAARSEYKGQRDDLEEQTIDLQRRNIDLNDRVNEMTAQIVVLQEQRRQAEQQINILRTENEQLMQSTAQVAASPSFESPEGLAMPDVTALTPVATRVIKGAIAEVDGNLLTISVGLADGVKEGMVFVIFRGDQYVGDMKVSLVDPDRSAGKLVRSTAQPMVGDQVTDVRSLQASQR